MSTRKNVQIVKDFFAAAFGGDREAMLALVAEDIEWIIPGENWPLAGTHRGHAGVTELLKTESETMEMSLSEPRGIRSESPKVAVRYRIYVDPEAIDPHLPHRSLLRVKAIRAHREGAAVDK
jgi:ketosteroid isomerase-like protein